MLYLLVIVCGLAEHEMLKTFTQEKPSVSLFYSGITPNFAASKHSFKNKTIKTKAYEKNFYTTDYGAHDSWSAGADFD